MSISISQSNNVSTEANSGQELLTTALSKNQQELEGQMVLQLLETANIHNVAAPTGNSGFQINIKV